MNSMDKYLRDKRVRLVRCSDTYTAMEPGSTGKIVSVDALGTVFVRWDDGTLLGLIPGLDLWEYEFLDKGKT